MRRYVHNVLASLLCVCLLISYTPLPASAVQQADDSADRGALVSDKGSSSVWVETQETILLDVTQSFAASIEEIKGNDAFDLKVVSQGLEPFSYQWSRAVIGEDGTPGTREDIEGATQDTYPLSLHADTLVNNTSYRYTVQVTDGKGAKKEAFVDVTVSDGYLHRVLPHKDALPRVEGLSIHKDSVLFSPRLDDKAAAIGSLRGQASPESVVEAWQLGMVGSPEGKTPYKGSLIITLPVNASAFPEGSDRVEVVGINAEGKPASFTATLNRDEGSVSFEADVLGVFAAVYPKVDGQSFTIKATAGAHGAISPVGSVSYQKGSRATYTVLPDEGYLLDSVTVDGKPVEILGNTYTFESVEADHQVLASFKKATPADPSAQFRVMAKVVEGKGSVFLGNGAPAAQVETRVMAGKGVYAHFLPDEGYAIDSVTLQIGDAAPVPINVFGSMFLLSAVMKDSVIEVAYKEGPAPVLPSHTVKAEAGEGGAVSPASQDVPHAGKATVTFSPNEGYALKKLTLNGEDATGRVSADGVLVLQNVVEDALVKAEFEQQPRSFVINAASSEGGSITPSGSVQVDRGDSAVFQCEAEDGYRLEKLYVDGRTAQAPSDGAYVFENVTANHSISAVFKKEASEPPITEYVTVSAASGPHGEISPQGDVRVPRGEACTFALLPEEGYAVDRVLVDGVDSVDRVSADGTITLPDLNADASVYVEFAASDAPAPLPKTYRIEASATAGGVISPSGDVRVVEGHNATFVFTAEQGNRLKSLEVDGVEVAVEQGFFTFEDVKANHAIRAVFEPVPVDPPVPAFVTVHAQAGEGGTLSPEGDVRVLKGSSQMFTLLPDEGYAVDAVTANGEELVVHGSTVTLFDIGNEVDLRATFKRVDVPVPPVNTHTVMSKAGPGGVISPAGATKVAEGGSVLYALIPDEGYRVDALTVDGMVYQDYDQPVYRFADVVEDHEIAVTFVRESDEPARDYVTVEARAGAGGAVSPEGLVRLPKNGTQTFYFFPEEGKRVSSISIDGREIPFSGMSFTLFDVSEDMTLSVAFSDQDDGQPPVPAPVTHNVTASAGEHGAVSPSGETKVIEGGSLLLTFEPEDGYEVDQVKVDDRLVQQGGVSYRLIDIMKDTSVSVTFKPTVKPDVDPDFISVHVRVEATAEGGLGGLVSPSGTMYVKRGASQTFYIFPMSGYDLDKALVNGQQVQVHSISMPTLLSARSAVGAGGGYQFTVESITNDTVVSVYFKKLAENDPAPDPVTACKVTASASSGGMISPSGAAWVARGGSISYALKADAGWHLETLTVDGADAMGLVREGTFQLAGVEKDTEVRATFAPDDVAPQPSPYATVHASSTEGGRVSPGGDVRVRTGESQTFAFLPEEGFVLDSVVVGDRKVVPIGGTYTLFDIVEDVELRATFRKKEANDPDPVIPVTFPVSASAGSGGSVWPSGVVDVAAGASILFTFVPDEGHELARVLLDDVQDVTGQASDGCYRLNPVTEPHTLLAEFAPETGPQPPAPQTYTVTATAGEHGAVSPAGAVSVPAGGSRQFVFLPDKGYEVDQVIVDGRSVPAVGDAYTLFDVQSNATLQVSFKKTAEELPGPDDKHVVTISSSEGGIVDPSGSFEVEDGASVAMTVTPDEGCELRSLTVNGADVTRGVTDGAYEIESVQEDVVVYARFAEAGALPEPDGTHTLTALVRGGHGSVSPAGDVRVAEGADQAFYFYPDEGFAVDSVEIDGVRLAWTPSSYVFERVGSDHSLTVSFKPVGVAGGSTDSIGSFAKSFLSKTGDGVWAILALFMALAAGSVVLIAARRRRGSGSAGLK